MYIPESDNKNRKKYTELAIADFTEAIRIDPNYENAYATRGAMYLKLKTMRVRYLTLKQP